MSLKLVTGYQGVDHVTAEQWADMNRGFAGVSGILNVGNNMSVQINSANEIAIKDGVALIDGREVYIKYGDTEVLTLESGRQAMKRNDIVVIKYTKAAESGIESVEFEVIQGTPSSSSAQDPDYDDQDIRTGVFSAQKPFCRVRINELAIEGIDMLLPEIKTLKDLEDGKAEKSHIHKSSDISDLSNASVNYANSAGSAGYANSAGSAESANSATSAGYAGSAGSVEWNNVKNKPLTYPPASHDHDTLYYQKEEVEEKFSAKLDSSRIISHSWVTQVNGTSIDVGFANVGMKEGKNYAIVVNNANRDASNITVIGVSINGAKNQFRIYWDNTFTGSVQFNLIAIEF